MWPLLVVYKSSTDLHFERPELSVEGKTVWPCWSACPFILVHKEALIVTHLACAACQRDITTLCHTWTRGRAFLPSLQRSLLAAQTPSRAQRAFYKPTHVQALLKRHAARCPNGSDNKPASVDECEHMCTYGWTLPSFAPATSAVLWPWAPPPSPPSALWWVQTVVWEAGFHFEMCWISTEHNRVQLCVCVCVCNWECVGGQSLDFRAVRDGVAFRGCWSQRVLFQSTALL